MAAYEDDLLRVSLHLLGRRDGQRGRLPGSRVRRSISTTYYALFHFLLDEVGKHVVGTSNSLRVRRRSLARTITHSGTRTALDKIRGANVQATVADFMRSATGPEPFAAPAFIRDLAAAFSDAQAKREDADYNLNAALSEADARLLRARVRRVIRAWKRASGSANRDAKRAVCILILMRGQLRRESL